MEDESMGFCTWIISVLAMLPMGEMGVEKKPGFCYSKFLLELPIQSHRKLIPV